MLVGPSPHNEQTTFKALALAQKKLTRSVAPHQLYNDFLKDLLVITNSEFGFIGEINYSATQHLPQLKEHASKQLQWNADHHCMYLLQGKRICEFKAANDLLNKIIDKGEVVIQTNKDTPEQSLLTKSYKSLLGIPVYFADALVAVIVLVNRTGRYDFDLVDMLTSLVKSYAQRVADNTGKDNQFIMDSLLTRHRYLEPLWRDLSTFMCVHDSRGHITATNQIEKKQFGYTPHELMNMSLLDIEKNADKEKRFNVWLALDVDERFEKHVVYCCKDGKELNASIKTQVVEHEEGKLFFSQIIIDEDQPNTSCVKSNHKVPIDYLLASSPVAIYTRQADGDREHTYVSENADLLFGYKADEFIHDHDFWKQHIHPEDVATVLNAFELLKDRSSDVYEYRFKSSNGSYCWIRDEVKVVTQNNGMQEIVGCWTNIDQRRKLDDELQESCELSKRLVSYMSLTAGSSINEAIDSTLEFIHQQLNIPHATIIVKDVHGRGYKRYTLGEEQESWVEGIAFFPPECSIVQKIQSKQTLYRNNITSSQYHFWDDEQRNAEGMLSDMFLPLMRKDECIGLLSVATDKEDGFSASLQNFMPLVNYALNQALLNAMLIASLENEREKLESSILEREQALSHAGRFRRALDRPDDAIFLIDPVEMKFIDFNSSAITSLGYSQDELLEMGPHDINVKYSQQMFKDMFNRLVNGQEDHYSLNTLHTSKEGKSFPVEIHFSLFRDLDGDNDQVIIIAMARDVSERNRAEIALRASEHRFRTLVDQSPFSTQILAPSGETMQVNKAWEALWGLKAEDLVNHNMLRDEQLVKKGIMPYIEAAFAGVPTEIPPIIYNASENPNIENGKANERWVRAFIYPVLDEQGKIQEVILMHEDITHRVEAEEELKKSQEKWRFITNNSPDNIMLLDDQFKIQFINSPLPGYSIEDVIGHSVLDYLPPDYVSVAKQCFQNVFETGKPEGFETEILINDKTRFYDSHVGTVSIDGSTDGLIVSSRDITRRKLAEEKLSQSAAVVENTAEGVVITNEKREIVAVNSAFTEITGYSEEEVKGKDPSILKSERHSDLFYSDMWNDINTTGRWQGEIWDRRKNGEIFPAWTTISAIHNNKGKLVNYVSVFSDISAIRRSQEKLDFLAYHDPLTNLPNRLLFNDRLEHAIQKAIRDNHQLAVLFIDLDRFKYINDTLGHLVGDKLIQQAAQRLNSSVRDVDTLARIGGDEFVIIMEDINTSKDAAILAEKVLNRFHHVFEIDGHDLHVTLSIGISIYPQDGDCSEQLIKSSDIALYQVKDEGRDGYNFYTPELASTAFERLSLETSLRHALTREEMVLYYQPQYSFKRNTTVGCEALVRWKHPEMGLVFPGKFIPIAEDSGLIIDLGEWVLYSACKQMKEWLEQGALMERVSVNISAIQLQRTDFVSVVESVLKHTQLPAKHLELELTETVVMHRADWAIDMLGQLRALGVTLSIDDFGTGYSSLAYLKRLPIDKLKIDRSFVSDIPGDDNDAVITETIIAMAKSLKMDVIAEGVETEEQLEFLRGLGCNEIQGYFYGRPVDKDTFYKEYIS